LNVAKKASGHKKSLKISDKTSLLVFRQFSGFFLCALLTAGLAFPACPEAVDPFLFQFDIVAFTALKEGFLPLF